MTAIFAKPTLTSEQKRRIKRLYERNNYRGIIAIAVDFLWIAVACLLPMMIHSAFAGRSKPDLSGAATRDRSN
jgi:hypothetical protein